MESKFAFLASVLGSDGASALHKAAERSTALGNALVPRAVIAWIDSQESYEGIIPGVENTYVCFAKSDDNYNGSITIGGHVCDFQGASPMHVAASLVIALGMDRDQIAAGVRDLELTRLGKSIDLLVRARALTEQLAKAQGKLPVHGTTAQAQKPQDQDGPAQASKQAKIPRPPVKHSEGYVPPAPKLKVALPKVKLPGVRIQKSEVPKLCPDCGTPMFNQQVLRGCMCLRDLLKSVRFEDEDEQHYILHFGGDLDVDAISLIVESLGANYAG
jgi:hypothetical protein